MTRTQRATGALALVATLLAGVTTAVIAQDNDVIVPAQLWSAWRFEPGIVIALVLSGWFYVRGVRALHARARRLDERSLGGAARSSSEGPFASARRGRESQRSVMQPRVATSRARRWPGIRKWEAMAFAAGWLALAIALVSPLHPLGETLFSAHMAQHTLLMVVAAPLLVLGRPVVAFLFAIPIRWRRALGRVTRARAVRASWRALTDPLVAFGMQTVALWVWHAPRLYQAALESEGIHALEHFSFLASALLYWWSLLHLRRRGGDGIAALSLFATMVQTGLLGALLTFSTMLWYPAYSARVVAWHLTPLEDQQLAGLIMWIPAGLVYIGAALAFVARLISDAELHADGVLMKAGKV